ncbi:hypothetical protein BDV93DRAFT_471089 [Ceratobasidium sp. AG-I]|nr:hypothetical protein BDV93DRAFT_471089 [Ceratobasidium sp. AG-I]
MSFKPIFHLEPRPHRELGPSTSSRKQHIRFTYDVLQVCLQRGDLERARRAWSALVRCPEIDMRTIWQVGLALIPQREISGKGKGKAIPTREHISYLKRVRLQIPDAQETLLKETVLALVDMGEYQEALDELDLYIVTMPFDQNPVLHLYAAMLWLYTAQPTPAPKSDSKEIIMKDDGKPIDIQEWNAARIAASKRHFRRALALDPDNSFARGFLDRLGSDVIQTQPATSVATHADEDDDMVGLTPMITSDQESEVRPAKKPRSTGKRRVA